ncbi:AraC family transcriptional regulator [Microvirga sp. W0021]|uniref:AraC family transcriptional regulator n=1 Tax=Hohaiivirga grylli TaxID=3133970 RepID=A0ABV0BG78_9HYPH
MFVRKEGVGSIARIIQHRELLMKQVIMEAPSLIQVISGSKIVRWATKERVAHSGEIIALESGQALDVINVPDDNSKLYEAKLISLDADAVFKFSEQDATSKAISCLYQVTAPSISFQDAFSRAFEAIADERSIPASAASARVQEVLAWLDKNGGYFRNNKIHTVERRVRFHISADIQSQWTAQHIASKLGFSEATLRRKLAEEGTSFNNTLIDVRMSRAYTLLQATDMPITQIAFEIGYDSPSRFSARFRDRFGYSPSVVRAAS